MAQRTGLSKSENVAAMDLPSRPVVMPQVFSGEGNWQEWRTSFDLYSTVNRWSEQDRIQWLAVCLTGDAAWAFQQLTAEQRQTYDGCVVGLTALLVPPNVGELNITLFRTRRKSGDEDWFAFARELSKLAAKAYPSFAPQVRDALALERFLAELGPEEWASSVRRSHPTTLMDAVRMAVQQLATDQAYPTDAVRRSDIKTTAVVGEAEETAAAVAPNVRSGRRTDCAPRYQKMTSSDEVRALRNEVSELKRLMEEMALQDSPLATRLRAQPSTAGRRMVGRTRCFVCGRRGHLRRDCPSMQRAESQPRYRAESWNKSLDAYSVANSLNRSGTPGSNAMAKAYAGESENAAVGACLGVLVKVHTEHIEMLIDTGAGRTLLRNDEFQRIKGQRKLSPCSIRLLSAGVLHSTSSVAQNIHWK
uniref:CCHC-type domain-containing protein n=1 Tax=Trichuris muris TaxID=70415 RepID=A0A5S6QFN0_TRIMR